MAPLSRYETVKRMLLYAIDVCQMVVFTLRAHIWFLLSPSSKEIWQRRFVKISQAVGDSPIVVPREYSEGIRHGIYSFEMLKMGMRVRYRTRFSEARENDVVPQHSVVYKVNPSERVISTVPTSLYEIARENVPLVVNFGSATCGPFMAALDQSFLPMVKRFSKVADFCIVYVTEAHPTDEWANPIVPIAQHKTMKDRLNAAFDYLIEKHEIHKSVPSINIYLDNINDNTSKTFGAYPDRLYILLNNKVVLQGGPGPRYYDSRVVEDWLKEYSSSS